MTKQKSKKRALTLLEKFSEAHGASGCENEIRRIIKDELKHDFHTDKTGNLIHEKKGTAERPRIMLAAHMDEVGFIVRNITKNGFLKFAPLGGWWAHTLLSQRVVIRTAKGDNVLGVIGAKSPHLLEKNEHDNIVKLDDMFIDVGAEDKEDIMNNFGIRLGDTIVPEGSFVPMHNPDHLLCKAFDDRVGVSLAVQTAGELENMSHPNTVFSVGTVQEEVGVRGAHTAVFGLDPDIAIVLECTPADDHPSIAEDDRQSALGRGVQIRLFDPTAIMNRAFTDFVIDIAVKNNIPHQVGVRNSGGTDARAIHLHGNGVPTIVLAVPARYIHTHNSIINIKDYLVTLDLILKLIQELDEKTVDKFTDFKD